MSDDETISETASPIARAGVLAGRRLKPREAADYIYRHGWRLYDEVVTAVAVMQAESQFYTEAVGGPNPDGTFDFGWCQINSDHYASFGYADVDALKAACFDPDRCAGMARSLYNGAGHTFRPWAAYDSGAYRRFLGVAVEGAANAAAVRLGLSPTPYLRMA